MIQKLIVLVLILCGWGCGGDKITPPQPEAVQAIKAEVQQMVQQSAELDEAILQVSQKLRDTTNQDLTVEKKESQKKLLYDLERKTKYMQVHMSELQSVLDRLVADYAAGKMTEEEFRKQYDVVKEDAQEMAISRQRYIEIVKQN